MSKHSIVRWGKIMGAYLLVAAVAALGWLWCALPEQVYLEPEQPLALPRFGWVEPLRGHGSRNVASTRAAGSYQTTLALGGWLPVKTIRATVMQRPTVTVCGTPFGVKMFSEGALVVGFSEVHTAAGTVNPAKQAGLRLGDRVIRMGNTVTETNEQVHAALEAAAGAAVEVVYVRKGEQRQTTLLPVWDTQNAQWRAGMWVRDSSAGIGTLTFVDNTTGTFAGLGHSIHDVDTGTTISLLKGEIVPVEITGAVAGSAGSPGELKGRFLTSVPTGTITVNGETGVYGSVKSYMKGIEAEVALAQEVNTGDAEIITTIEGQEPKRYTAVIEKIALSSDNPNRNMVVRVTDPRLLTATGGIVQGMSGSPILQDGRLVGAVTHVLVNDPTRGYGIFAENMVQSADAAAQREAA